MLAEPCRRPGPVAVTAGEELARRVVAQGVVIVDVFVTQGDARDPLGQESGERVDRPGGVAPVGEAGRHAFEQAYPVRPLAQQQDAGVGGDLAAVEGGEHHPFAEIRKAHPFLLADRCSGTVYCGFAVLPRAPLTASRRLLLSCWVARRLSEDAVPVSKNRHKNKKNASAGRGQKAAAPPLPPVPDRRAMERTMAKLAGGMSPDGPAGGEEEALARARDLIYDAWRRRRRASVSGWPKGRWRSPISAPTPMFCWPRREAKTLAEARRHYQAGVAAGEWALGRQAFERDAGHFWVILETRPYMRARAGLAECLWQEGERTAAIDHYREMLRLNPNDNQGLRHGLASWLLAAGDHGALEELLAHLR